jgi:hypothetical protein
VRGDLSRQAVPVFSDPGSRRAAAGPNYHLRISIQAFRRELRAAPPRCRCTHRLTNPLPPLGGARPRAQATVHPAAAVARQEGSLLAPGRCLALAAGPRASSTARQETLRDARSEAGPGVQAVRLPGRLRCLGRSAVRSFGGAQPHVAGPLSPGRTLGDAGHLSLCPCARNAFVPFCVRGAQPGRDKCGQNFQVPGLERFSCRGEPETLSWFVPLSLSGTRHPRHLALHRRRPEGHAVPLPSPVAFLRIAEALLDPCVEVALS